MPREIDCPDCKWRHTHSSLNPVNQHELVLCGNCNNGKITVYTEEEFQEAIGEYANTKLYQEGYRSGKKEVENLISTVRDLIEETGNQLYIDQDGIGSIPEARRLIEKTLEVIDGNELL